MELPMLFWISQAGVDEVQIAVDMVRAMLFQAFWLALPLLTIGLVVGLMVAVFQAATSVQEQTLSFIPKMFAVVVVLVTTFPWMLKESSL